MRAVALDTETWLTSSNGLKAPRLVSVSVAWGSGPDEVRLWHRDEAEPHLAALFADPDVRIVGQWLAFDLAVLCENYPSLHGAIWRLYDEGRVGDTKIADQMEHIAQGDFRVHKYNLAALCKRVLGVEVAGKKGEDVWRLNYWRLDEYPIDQWPAEAVRYARDDATLTYRLWEHYEAKLRPTFLDQMRADWALFLMSARGLRADCARVAALEERLTKGVAEVQQTLCDAQILVQKGTKARPKLVEDQKSLRQIVEDELGTRAPRTPTGKVQTSDSVLDKLSHPAIEALRTYRKLTKLQSTYLEPLKTATEKAVCAWYNTLVDSGRSSCFGPNMQNQPRKGGVREAWRPRDGYVFVLADYAGAELAPLGETCLKLFGYSRLAETMIEGRDAHWNTLAAILGMTYEEVVARKGEPEISDKRTLAKAANFGFPGYLSARGFVPYAAGYGVKLTAEESHHVRSTWFQTYPEMGMLRKYVESQQKRNPRGDYVQMANPLCGFERGGMTPPVASNGLFQTPVAIGAKRALYAVARACRDPLSPLHGSYPVAFVHDEIVLETPEDKAAGAAEELVRLMDAAMRTVMPRVPCPAEPAITRVWSKDAEPVYDADGRLIEWSPP